MFIRFKLQYSFALNMTWWYMTLDILSNAFFFSVQKIDLSFMLIQSSVKAGWAKNTRERDRVYATFLVISKLDVCFDEADVERIILWCHLWGVALAFASRIRALKVCFHCFGKVFLWCCQRLQKDVKELPWAFQRFSLWLSVFFEDTQTASPSRFFSRLHLSSTPRSFLRKLFNRPSMKSSKCFKLLNHFIGKTFLFVILVQNPALSFSVNNVFRIGESLPCSSSPYQQKLLVQHSLIPQRCNSSIQCATIECCAVILQ